MNDFPEERDIEQASAIRRRRGLTRAPRPVRFDEDRGEWRVPIATRRQIALGHVNELLASARELRRRQAELKRLRADEGASFGRDLWVSMGSGSAPPRGWVGVDRKRGPRVYDFDLRFPLPLANSSVSGILCEHILEHFPLDDLGRMFADYSRILIPGGPIRIVSPDAILVAMLIRNVEHDRVRRQLEFDAGLHGWPVDNLVTRWDVINRITYQFGQHQSLLSAPLVRELLMRAGFTNVVELQSNTTQWFEEVPTTHFVRFPDSAHEVFAIEALNSTVKP